MINGDANAASEIEGRLQTAREAYERLDYQSCRNQLLEIQRTGSRDPEVYRWLARLAHRETDWEGLYANASAFLQTNPEDRESVQLLARACSNLKLWPEAERAWEHLAAIRSDWPEGKYQLARARLNNGHRAGFMDTVRELGGLGNGDGRAELLVARLYIEAELFTQAGEAFRSCAAACPEQLLEEFATYSGRKNLRGMAAVCAAIEAASTPDARRSLLERLVRRAISAERTREFADAYLDYAAARLLAPEDGLAARGMTRVLQQIHAIAHDQVQKREWEKALSSYEKLLELAPSDTRAALQRAKLLMQLHRWVAAAEAWSELCEASPGDSKGRVQHARATERAGHLDKAENAWRRVLETESGNSESLTALARLPERMMRAARTASSEGRLVDAYEMLSRVPAGCAEREDAEKRLGRLALQLKKQMRSDFKEKQFLKIVQISGPAMKLLPDDVEVHKLVAKAASRSSNYAMAIAAWQRFVELAPESDVTSYLEWARCCMAVAEFDQCRKVLAMVLERQPANEKARELQLDLEEYALMHGRAADQSGERMDVRPLQANDSRSHRGYLEPR